MNTTSKSPCTTTDIGATPASLGQNPTGVAQIKTTSARMPGELGLWIFLLADMSIFALYFWVFIWNQSLHPEQFQQGQASLNHSLGLLNTVILLSSSYFAAMAVHSARGQNLNSFRRNIQLTIACGTGFLLVKAIEYGEKLDAGLHLASNEFYSFYFVFTGIHMVHVIIGLSLLSYLLFSLTTAEKIRQQMANIEGTALYWHMVDLLWVVLFSLIYLLQ